MNQQCDACGTTWSASEKLPCPVCAETAPVAWLYEHPVLGRNVQLVDHNAFRAGSERWTKTPLYAGPAMPVEVKAWWEAEVRRRAITGVDDYPGAIRVAENIRSESMFRALSALFDGLENDAPTSGDGETK